MLLKWMIWIDLGGTPSHGNLHITHHKSSPIFYWLCIPCASPHDSRQAFSRATDSASKAWRWWKAGVDEMINVWVGWWWECSVNLYHLRNIFWRLILVDLVGLRWIHGAYYGIFIIDHEFQGFSLDLQPAPPSSSAPVPNHTPLPVPWTCGVLWISKWLVGHPKEMW